MNDDDNDNETIPDDPLMIPADDATAGAQEPKHAIPRWAKIFIPLLLVVGLTGTLVHTDEYAIGPGPATDVLSLIKVSGTKTYPSSGKLLITTAAISSHTLTVWERVWAWIDPKTDTINSRFLKPPGVSDAEQDAQNLRDMEASKIAAEAAAFRALGKPVTDVTGALVLAVPKGSPSRGKLFPDDVVLSVDGIRTQNGRALIAAVRRHKIGEKAQLVVRRAAHDIRVTITTYPSPSDQTKAALGISIGENPGHAYSLPEKITINTQQIGGPSGGLVFALSIYDAFTPFDLTRGHIVAVTGTIDAAGNVGAIGAIGEKIRGARAVGADIFLAPSASGEAAEATRLAPKGLRVIGVRTLREAISALRRLPPRAAGPG